jgi:hypothetical protein
MIIRMFAVKRWTFPSDKLFVTVLSMGDISDPTTKSQIYDTWADSFMFTFELSKEPRQIKTFPVLKRKEGQGVNHCPLVL